MPCLGRCFSSIDGGQGKPIDHDEPSQPGLTWYFCPAHRRFHAISFSRCASQPLCGECAVLFFGITQQGLWMQHLDLNAIMSNAQQLIEDALDDFDALMLEVEQFRFAQQQEVTGGPLLPSACLPHDLLAEIPKEDSTYINLSTTLIPHKCISGLSLLKYQTFHGVAAYQPCSRTIDKGGIFDALGPIDRNGDPVFKQARVWCCIVQARSALPKELRWVLATMYNFCNEMLRSEQDEDTLWQMRQWLMHWYNVADRLLYRYGISESAPDVDWFARPISRAPEHSHAPGHEATVSWQSSESKAMQHESDNSSGRRIVIRHRSHWACEKPWASSLGLTGNRVAAIPAWLDQQPYLSDVDETSTFDPTPSGYVSPKTRRAMLSSSLATTSGSLATPSGNWGSFPSWSRLNPRAAVFYPQIWPLSLTEKESLQESDESLASDEDDDGETETTACSCSLSSTCRMLPYAGFRERATGLGHGLGDVAKRLLNVGAS
ncbi:hypothetical protein G6O67_001954 [Ophiocordyceps sinensis]|uniref:Uncharacterized protein n=2 Tax=Ophiocordyceps sinensis TaxID=72228 RepID=A0A8H4PTG9_9HYPO|nr:hypothetical protein G6O67_001954 [Ophiocordyceps sinensis]